MSRKLGDGWGIAGQNETYASEDGNLSIHQNDRKERSDGLNCEIIDCQLSKIARYNLDERDLFVFMSMW